jgi:hypothetical protein
MRQPRARLSRKRRAADERFRGTANCRDQHEPLQHAGRAPAAQFRPPRSRWRAAAPRVTVRAQSAFRPDSSHRPGDHMVRMSSPPGVHTTATRRQRTLTRATDASRRERQVRTKLVRCSERGSSAEPVDQIGSLNMDLVGIRLGVSWLSPHPVSRTHRLRFQLWNRSISREKSGRLDLNQRPFGPQPNALPDCATPRGIPSLRAHTESGRPESNRLFELGRLMCNR